MLSPASPLGLQVLQNVRLNLPQANGTGYQVNSTTLQKLQKNLVKAFVEVPMASAGSSVIEFKADHTYIKTLSGKYQPKPVTLTGTWSVSGNQFEMKMDAHQTDPKTNPTGNAASTTTTISVSGNTLTVSVPVSGDNPMTSKINKIEETYKKM